jgi:hypothetical protein
MGWISAMVGDFSNLRGWSDPVQNFDLDGEADGEA